MIIPKSRQRKNTFQGTCKVHFPFLALKTSCEGSKIREKGNDPEKWSFCLVHSCPHRWSLLEFFFLFWLFQSKSPFILELQCIYCLLVNAMQQEKYSHTHFKYWIGFPFCGVMVCPLSFLTAVPYNVYLLCRCYIAETYVIIHTVSISHQFPRN